MQQFFHHASNIFIIGMSNFYFYWWILNLNNEHIYIHLQNPETL